MFNLFPINPAQEKKKTVAADVGLKPGMSSSASVSHNEEFPSIRQRELQA